MDKNEIWVWMGTLLGCLFLMALAAVFGAMFGFHFSDN